jgi:hypothetical protein
LPYVLLVPQRAASEVRSMIYLTVLFVDTTNIDASPICFMGVFIPYGLRWKQLRTFSAIPPFVIVQVYAKFVGAAGRYWMMIIDLHQIAHAVEGGLTLASRLIVPNVKQAA